MTTAFVTPEARNEELNRIREGMIRKEYFVMHRRSRAPELKAKIMLEHFQWIVELEKKGHILMTGAIFHRDGTQSEGLTIFRAESWEAAEELAASDPVVESGADTFYIERFRLGGGRFTVSIDFSDRSFSLG